MDVVHEQPARTVECNVISPRAKSFTNFNDVPVPPLQCFGMAGIRLIITKCGTWNRKAEQMAWPGHRHVSLQQPLEVSDAGTVAIEFLAEKPGQHLLR